MPRQPDSDTVQPVRIIVVRDDADGETIQNEVYAVGKDHGYENLRDWFKALYEVLLGQEQGPRMGSFMALYGLAESLALIGQVLEGESLTGS